MAVTDGTESLRGEVEFVFFESKIENAVFVNVFRQEGRVFHVCVVDGTLLAEKMNDLDGIAALPVKMAEVVVGANLFANGFTEFQERAWIIDDEVGMHLESEAPHAVVVRVLRSIFPVRNHF